MGGMGEGLHINWDVSMDMMTVTQKREDKKKIAICLRNELALVEHLN